MNDPKTEKSPKIAAKLPATRRVEEGIANSSHLGGMEVELLANCTQPPISTEVHTKPVTKVINAKANPPDAK